MPDHADRPAAPETPQPALGAIVDFKTAFPNVAASWYLLGSHADSSAIDVSDVDLLGLVWEIPAPVYAWRDRTIESFGGQLELHIEYPAELGCVPLSHFIPMLVHARLIDGDDVRPQLPQLEMTAYRETVAWKFGRAVEHFHPSRRPDALPDPDLEFLGFTERPGEWTGLNEWTHPIVVLLGKGSCAIAALSGRASGSRNEALRHFRDCDESGLWADYCTQGVGMLRDDWRYRVPADRDDRARLLQVVARLCEFEAHCLGRLEAASIPIFRT